MFYKLNESHQSLPKSLEEKEIMFYQQDVTSGVTKFETRGESEVYLPNVACGPFMKTDHLLDSIMEACLKLM